MLTLIRDGCGGGDEYGNDDDGGHNNEGYDTYIMIWLYEEEEDVKNDCDDIDMIRCLWWWWW